MKNPVPYGTGSAIAIYPSYNLAQRINIAYFFTRIEVLMAASWFITIYLLCIQNPKLLVTPLSMIPLILSFYIYPNISYLFKYERTIWTYAAMPFLFGIPMLLLVVGKIRKLI